MKREMMKLLLLFLCLAMVFNALAAEDLPAIPQAVLDKMEQLRRGELNQLEKIKLADELQRAGAKPESLALYQENLPTLNKNQKIPPEAYLNYGTALLEKGEEQKGLEVYENLKSSLDPHSPQTKKLQEMMEKNVVNFFKVQEEKKQQEKKEQKDKKENKDKQDPKDGQSGENGSDKKDQQGSGQNSKDQQDKKQQDKQSKEEKDKEKKDQQDKKDKEEKKSEEDDKKDQDKSPQEGEKSQLPPPKMPPKLKQLMSDDRQLQLKVIEQGTRDMNRRNSRENKDW